MRSVSSDRDRPKVSVVMATYDGSAFLREQLDSIYAQSFGDFEVVVVDDASSDRTPDILERYRAEYGLRYIRNDENEGFLKSFERALSLASGDYIALCDQDDIWVEEKLEVMLDSIGDSLLAHSDCYIVDDRGEKIADGCKGASVESISGCTFLFKNVVTGCTILMKRELLESALPFPDGIVYHDWWLALSASCRGGEEGISYIPRALVGYRRHTSQHTGVSSVGRRVPEPIAGILARIGGMETRRMKWASIQLSQLEALRGCRERHCYGDTEIDDAESYFESFVKSPFHPLTFFRGLKYAECIYPGTNPLYLRNILYDIAG